MSELSNDNIPADEMDLAQALAVKGARNQRFARLSPEKKRVAIAKDVVARLKAKLFVPTPGYYLADPAIAVDRGPGVLPEDVVDVVNGFTCGVCALGGLFAAAVDMGEAGGTVVSYYDSAHCRNVAFQGMGIRDRMADIFDERQLGLVECAFEGPNGAPCGAKAAAGYPDDDHPVWAWHERYTDDTLRMKAIMENIIANKGTFIP